MAGRQIDPKDLSDRFTTHVPTPAQEEAMASLRAMTYDLAYEYDDRCPPGRYLSLAITALEEAVMWSSKAILLDAPTVPTVSDDSGLLHKVSQLLARPEAVHDPVMCPEGNDPCLCGANAFNRGLRQAKAIFQPPVLGAGVGG